MNIWKPNSIEQEPVTELSRWLVYEIDSLDAEGRDHHMVGTCRSDPGRVSSKIKHFDRETMTATTRSGRKYRLVGEPCVHIHASYVWETWKKIMKVNDETVVDVSDQYYEED